MADEQQTHEQADERELLDPEALTRSLNGFEEMVIEQHFRAPVHVLMQKGTPGMRALLFVLAKRDGAADVDAFRTVMLLPLEDVVSRFVDEEASDPGEA